MVDNSRQLASRLNAYEALAKHLLAIATDASTRARILAATKFLNDAVEWMRGRNVDGDPDAVSTVQMALEAAAVELSHVQDALRAHGPDARIPDGKASGNRR